MKRRVLLKRGLAALASIPLFAKYAKGQADEQTCHGRVTPSQAEGPFYPQSRNWEADQDLTVTDKNSGGIAKGWKLILAGQVVGENCEFISGAKVEIWQADTNGRYNHSADPRRRRGKLDSSFQYYSRVFSDKEGAFSFKTIKPGAYPASRNWVRPPHIHVKVWANGYFPLITQIYFEPADTDLDTFDRDCLKADSALRKLFTAGNAKAATQYVHDKDSIIRRTGEARADVILKSEVEKDGTPVFGFRVTLKKAP